MPTRIELLRENARKRTEAQRAATEALPSALVIAEEAAEEKAEFVGNNVITINGKTFNPYQIQRDDGSIIELNVQQRQAVDWFGLQGRSGCLIGPAGTGKTTTMKAIMQAAMMSGRIPIIPDDDTHKYVATGTPGIWGGSFTRIATRNLRDNVPNEIKRNIHTMHRLLEFEPDFTEVEIKDKMGKGTGEFKNIRIFRPTRNKFRTLSRSIVSYFIDEGSMVGTDLHQKFLNALPGDVQIVYIGDIAQLPPVMDDSILGYKLLELPVVELTEVYRHAGRIVNLANHIRTGHTIPDAKKIFQYSGNLRRLPRALVEEGIAEWNGEEDGSKVTIHLWKTRFEGKDAGEIRALKNLKVFFQKEHAAGDYNPTTDMILIPYNKAVGTLELNKEIAQFLGEQRDAEVWEVIAGFNKHYMAVGDKVFFDREEAVITKIAFNANYAGRIPQAKSKTLNRWGHNTAKIDEDEIENPNALNSIDNMLMGVTLEGDVKDEDRVNQASHVIYVKKLRDMVKELGADEHDAEPEDESDSDNDGHSLRTASEINSLLGGYALTIHKSQGSQWKKCTAYSITVITKTSKGNFYTQQSLGPKKSSMLFVNLRLLYRACLVSILSAILLPRKPNTSKARSE
jgi:hypothetical protein